MKNTRSGIECKNSNLFIPERVYCTLGEIRTHNHHILSMIALPISVPGHLPVLCTLGEIRTHTNMFLRHVPLPVGLRGHKPPVSQVAHIIRVTMLDAVSYPVSVNYINNVTIINNINDNHGFVPWGYSITFYVASLSGLFGSKQPIHL